MGMMNVHSFRFGQALHLGRRNGKSRAHNDFNEQERLDSRVLWEIIKLEILTYLHVDPIRHNLLNHPDIESFQRSRQTMDEKTYTNEGGLPTWFRDRLIDRATTFIMPSLDAGKSSPRQFLIALDDILLDHGTIGAARTLNHLALVKRPRDKEMFQSSLDFLRICELSRLRRIGTEAALEKLKYRKRLHDEMTSLVDRL